MIAVADDGEAVANEGGAEVINSLSSDFALGSIVSPSIGDEDLRRSYAIFY
jgi:hypothetical protein